ncbi:MAG: hypothetical protein P8182_10385 [Deltaproteobacteria bacterium]
MSSESRAIQNLEMDVVRDVRPGEIVLINDKGLQTVQQIESLRRAHCAFEWAYTSSIDSVIEGIYVQAARNNMGASLAQRDKDEGGLEANFVVPVPMSGIGHAIGYHRSSHLNYQEVFLYNRFADRSYTPSIQLARERMAKRKLSVLRHSVKNKRIVLCDDSIVRGTQIMHKVRDLKMAGAKEVHVRVACPPLMYPCGFGVSTRSYDELLARSFLRPTELESSEKLEKLEKLEELEEWTAKQTGADSVKYNSLGDFVHALGIPGDALCLKCWNGKRPTER